ncbi:MAG: serine esterase [Verrucomicrobia bacterium]|nr:serine esterase [Verrucomicrobiota bacterium]
MLDTELIPATEADSKWLMVVLHGLGDSMEGFRWLPSALDNPRLNTLLVNAPDGYLGGFSWYDIAAPAAGVERSRRLLFDLLDRQRADGFAPEQTFLFGFSQGCLMTVEIGLRYPHRLAGLIGISGYAHEPGSLVDEQSPVAAEQSFLITHGTADPLLPLARTRAQMEQLQAGGIRMQWEVFEKAHTIQGEAEVTVIRKFVEGRMNRS